MNDREKIDYYLKKKKEANDKELKEWGCAFMFSVVVFIAVFLIIGLWS